MACQHLQRGGFMSASVCGVTKKEVTSYTRDNVCDTWGKYTDCADYKKASSCFITTAVCESLGKPDDCAELQTMRAFRDEWLSLQEDGPAAIAAYYRVAPQICQAIDGQEDPTQVYLSIYQDYLVDCVAQATEGNYQACYVTGQGMLADLGARYLPSTKNSL